VEDVGTAIVKLLQNDGTSGRVFTLSHQDSPTSQDYVDGYVRKRHRETLHVIYVPHWLAALGVRSMVAVRRLTRRGPRMNMRRLAYVYRDVRVDSSAIVAQTGWQPTGKMLERLAAIGRDEEVDQV
jgi:nucleoside-diphosphate-sugar epimerase